MRKTLVENVDQAKYTSLKRQFNSAIRDALKALTDKDLDEQERCDLADLIILKEGRKLTRELVKVEWGHEALQPWMNASMHRRWASVPQAS